MSNFTTMALLAWICLRNSKNTSSILATLLRTFGKANLWSQRRGWTPNNRLCYLVWIRDIVFSILISTMRRSSSELYSLQSTTSNNANHVWPTSNKLCHGRWPTVVSLGIQVIWHGYESSFVKFTDKVNIAEAMASADSDWHACCTSTDRAYRTTLLVTCPWLLDTLCIEEKVTKKIPILENLHWILENLHWIFRESTLIMRTVTNSR